MYYRLLITEVTHRIAHPIPLDQIIFVKMAPFSISHIKKLILAGIFPVQMCLNCKPVSFSVSALYTDLIVNIPFLPNFQGILSEFQ